MNWGWVERAGNLRKDDQGSVLPRPGLRQRAPPSPPGTPSGWLATTRTSSPGVPAEQGTPSHNLCSRCHPALDAPVRRWEHRPRRVGAAACQTASSLAAVREEEGRGRGMRVGKGKNALSAHPVRWARWQRVCSPATASWIRIAGGTLSRGGEWLSGRGNQQPHWETPSKDPCSTAQVASPEGIAGRGCPEVPQGGESRRRILHPRARPARAGNKRQRCDRDPVALPPMDNEERPRRGTVPAGTNPSIHKAMQKGRGGDPSIARQRPWMAPRWLHNQMDCIR